ILRVLQPIKDLINDEGAFNQAVIRIEEKSDLAFSLETASSAITHDLHRVGVDVGMGDKSDYKIPGLPENLDFNLGLFGRGETVDYDRLGILRKVLGVFAEGPLSSKAANFNAKPGELSLFGAVPTQITPELSKLIPQWQLLWSLFIPPYLSSEITATPNKSRIIPMDLALPGGGESVIDRIADFGRGIKEKLVSYGVVPFVPAAVKINNQPPQGSKSKEPEYDNFYHLADNGLMVKRPLLVGNGQSYTHDRNYTDKKEDINEYLHYSPFNNRIAQQNNILEATIPDRIDESLITISSFEIREPKIKTAITNLPTSNKASENFSRWSLFNPIKLNIPSMNNAVKGKLGKGGSDLSVKKTSSPAYKILTLPSREIDLTQFGGESSLRTEDRRGILYDVLGVILGGKQQPVSALFSGKILGDEGGIALPPSMLPLLPQIQLLPTESSTKNPYYTSLGKEIVAIENRMNNPHTPKNFNAGEYSVLINNPLTNPDTVNNLAKSPISLATNSLRLLVQNPLGSTKNSISNLDNSVKWIFVDQDGNIGDRVSDFKRLGILGKVLGAILSNKAANFNAKPGEFSLFGAVPTQKEIELLMLRESLRLLLTSYSSFLSGHTITATTNKEMFAKIISSLTQKLNWINRSLTKYALNPSTERFISPDAISSFFAEVNSLVLSIKQILPTIPENVKNYLEVGAFTGTKKGDRRLLEVSSPAELADSSKLIAHSLQLIEYKIPKLPSREIDLTQFGGESSLRTEDRRGILYDVLGAILGGKQ
ncbi:MAG: hypothetical protein KKB76_07770, partial [Candidatus Omnitrophica bacterium]|nr:hypothetical protein [Candidatus Omnitrophota bacterium]